LHERHVFLVAVRKAGLLQLINFVLSFSKKSSSYSLLINDILC
jgi:hypothetical protein